MAKGPVAPGIWAQEGKDGFRSEKLGGSEVYSAYKIPPPLWREALGKQLAERKAGKPRSSPGQEPLLGHREQSLRQLFKGSNPLSSNAWQGR